MTEMCHNPIMSSTTAYKVLSNESSDEVEINGSESVTTTAAQNDGFLNVDQQRNFEPDTQHIVQDFTTQKGTLYVYILTALSGIGGFLFGYDTGVVSGALILLGLQYPDLTNFKKELFVSITIGCAAIFALASGPMNDFFGRKPVILLASVLFTVGAVVLAAAQNFYMLLSGRAVLGIAIGLLSMTVPVYIAESAPVHLRGRLVTTNVLCITFGQFVAALIGGAFSTDERNGWRFMLGLAAIPSFIQLVGFIFMPESPRWLISHSKPDRARSVLVKLRGNCDVSEEFDEIQQACNEYEANRTVNGGSHLILQVFKVQHVRRAVLIGCMLQIFQQLSGINTVMYYSASIIKMSGIQSNSLAIWLASITAGTNCAFTLVGLWLVEKIGRRKLLLSSSFGTVCSLACLAISFQLAAVYSPAVTEQELGNSTVNLYNCSVFSTCHTCQRSKHCGYCFELEHTNPVNASCVPFGRMENVSAYGRCSIPKSNCPPAIWATDFCPSKLAWMATAGLVLYLACFAPGMGPMPWTINSEIYPQWARATGNSLATTMNWTFNLLVSLTFLTLTDVLTSYGAFWLYTGLAFIGFTLSYLLVPETKGRRLEDMEELFKKPLCTSAIKKPAL